MARIRSTSPRPSKYRSRPREVVLSRKTRSAARAIKNGEILYGKGSGHVATLAPGRRPVSERRFGGQITSASAGSTGQWASRVSATPPKATASSDLFAPWPRPYAAGQSDGGGPRRNGSVPPRFLVSASRYAIVKGASAPELSQQVIKHHHVPEGFDRDGARRQQLGKNSSSRAASLGKRCWVNSPSALRTAIRDTRLRRSMPTCTIVPVSCLSELCALSASLFRAGRRPTHLWHHYGLA
jgi:hypothetical protein